MNTNNNDNENKNDDYEIIENESYKTIATIYHPVLQRTEEWFLLRKGRLSGSQIGTATGISKYQNPIDFFLSQIQPEIEFVSNPACEHGTRMEPYSVDLIKNVIFPKLHKFFVCAKIASRSQYPNLEKLNAWVSQHYSKEPGYHTPNPEKNPNFKDPEDAKLFGLSLDMEGSEIDVEIKNPFTTRSFWSNYIKSISPLYFAQVQWSMAMRGRQEMFLVATSYTTEKKPRLMAYVVWHVSFSKKFFDTFLYPKGRFMIETIRSQNPMNSFMIENYIPHLYENQDYEQSDEFKKVFSKHATRLYVKKFPSPI
jgi:hypothetical protein